MEIPADEAVALLKDARNLAVRQPTFIRGHGGSRNGSAGSGGATTNQGREIPQTLRILIGASAHHDSIKDVAESFGVSESTVAAAKAGRVGVNRYDKDLHEAVVKASGKDTVREAAIERLAGMFASVINDQNLAAMKAREAVSAAKDLATIVDKLTPKQGGANIAVFVHAPRIKDEKEFGKIIEVPYRQVEEKKLT